MSALIRSAVRDITVHSATDVPSPLAAGWDVMTGQGNIDLDQALSRVDSTAGPVTVIRAEITGLPTDVWTIPAGSTPVAVTAVIGEPGDVGLEARLEVGFGAEPDFSACPSATCVLLAWGSPAPDSTVTGSVDPDVLPEGRSVLRLWARDAAGNEYEDRVGIVIDNMQVDWPAWDAVLPYPGPVEVRGAFAAWAAGSVHVSLAAGADPPGTFSPLFSASAPATGVIGSFSPTSSGVHTLRFESEVAGFLRREDVRVRFVEELAPPWPVPLPGGMLGDRMVLADVSDVGAPSPGPGVALLRQVDPYQDAHDAEIAIVEPRGEARIVSTHGSFPSPICAANVDRLAGDEIAVLWEDDPGGWESGLAVRLIDAAGTPLPGFAPDLTGSRFPGEWVTGTDGQLLVDPSLFLDDVDGDGWTDIVVMSGRAWWPAAGPALHVVDHTGTTRYSTDPTSAPLEVGSFSGVDGAADFDGDGRKEIVVRTRRLADDPWQSMLTLFRVEPASGRISRLANVAVGWPERVGLSTSALGDLDGDGVPEIVSAGVPTITAIDRTDRVYVFAHQVSVAPDGTMTLAPQPGFARFMAVDYDLYAPSTYGDPRLGLALAALADHRPPELLFFCVPPVYVV